MSRLDQIKEEVSKENGFSRWWEDDEATFNFKRLSKFWPEVCKRYAIECSQASLEKGANNATIEESYFLDDYSSINLSSIKNSENIVLL